MEQGVVSFITQHSNLGFVIVLMQKSIICHSNTSALFNDLMEKFIVFETNLPPTAAIVNNLVPKRAARKVHIHAELELTSPEKRSFVHLLEIDRNPSRAFFSFTRLLSLAKK